MTTQEKLIDAMQAAFPGESQAALARRAGLSVQRFNNYVTGIRTMDVDAVIGCAQALGWDIRETVAAHELETAPTPRVKAYWKKLASTAAVFLCAIGFSFPSAGKDHSFNDLPTQISSSVHSNAYYVTRRGYYWQLLKLLLEQLLRLSPSSKDSGSFDACRTL